jgi:hypothetical protein
MAESTKRQTKRTREDKEVGCEKRDEKDVVVEAGATLKKCKRKDEKGFVRVKHVAPKDATASKIFWVSRRSNQAHLIGRCSTMLEKGDIVLNGLGAAILTAIDLSLELNRRWNNQLVLDVKTTTVELTDELRPDGDGLDTKIDTRFNSGVSISIRKRTGKQ